MDLAKLEAGNDITEVAAVVTDTTIEVTDESFMSPSDCILYCNGLDMGYALVSQLTCVCASNITVGITHASIPEIVSFTSPFSSSSVI